MLCSLTSYAGEVQLVLQGQCPDQTAMSSALKAAGLASDVEATLEIHSSEGQASLSVEVSGQEIVAREVVSNDCSAVAEAFALITADALSNVPKAPAESAVVVEVAASDEAVELSTQATSPIEAKPTGSPLAFGIIAGFGTASNSTALPSFAQVDLSLRYGPGKLRAAVWGDSTESFAEDLSSRQLGARLEFGKEFGSQYWLRPTAGAGFVVSQVSSSLPERKDLTRLHPIVVSTISAGIRLNSVLSFRADLRGLWFPVADRYISQAKSVGESPRSILSLGLGLEWKVR